MTDTTLRCDCATAYPTYPTYREKFHVAPCVWAEVERLQEQIARLQKAVAWLASDSADDSALPHMSAEYAIENILDGKR